MSKVVVDIVWPAFHNNGTTYPTEFVAGKWKCPLCDYSTTWIGKHLAKHKSIIQDWNAAETYIKEMAMMKRNETKRKADVKRASDPKRKETMKKAQKKYSQTEHGKEAAMGAKKKYSQTASGKEVAKEAQKKYTQTEPGKEASKEARRKYMQTKMGKYAKIIAQENYREKLGVTRRKAQFRRYAQTKVDKARGGNAVTRRLKFQRKVLRGPEYVCSCCHRSLFKKSVVAVTEYMREKIRLASEEKMRKANEEKSRAKNQEDPPSLQEHQPSNPLQEHQPSNPKERKSKLKKAKKFSFEIDAFKAWIAYHLTSVDDLSYLCKTCQDSLKTGNIPAMAVANGLQLNHPDRPRLSELENNLVAHTINFQKMVLLPKSRMAAGKGRMISIPVGPEVIMNTAKQLPRLPTEAGVVPIKLKRKKEYKSHEKNEMIRPEQIFLALRYLRKQGHPYYQFYDEKESYLARCRIKDQRGLRLLQDDADDIEENLEKPNTPELADVEDKAMGDPDDNEAGEDEMEIAVEQELEDIESDPVRRQHFNYNEYSTLVNGHPDIFLNSEGNQVADLDFAPGEGKKPTSFLDQKDWDLKSWPMLLPDGKFGFHWERRKKLTRQQYFQQRLLNVDDRFAGTPGYLFGAMSMVEAERLRKNANLTGMKGKRTVGPGGKVSYQLEDPCTVFEKIKGTPKYWQRVKYEMIAKLENIGPFQIFFTLTAGDQRWSANFTPELEKMGCKIHYDVDTQGKENVTVEVTEDKRKVSKPWQQYLKDHVDESQHEMMKRNVLRATRNFQHRMETFRQEVIFGPNNPMRVRHISYRVEFQGRGAAHVHGVLWLDLKEIKVEGVNNIVLQESYRKLKNSQPLEPYEKRALQMFTDTFVTCTRCVSMAGAEAVRIAEEVNWHGHSSSCKKGGKRVCRWKFPRYPLARTIFVDANRDNEYDHEDFTRMDASKREEILDRVMKVLVKEEGNQRVLSKRVKNIMIKYPNVKKINSEESESEEEDTSEDEEPFQSHPEDPSSQDFNISTPNPKDYLPADMCSPSLSLPSTPNPKDYLPADMCSPSLSLLSTPNPKDYLPADMCSPSPSLSLPSTPNPKDYLPADMCSPPRSFPSTPNPRGNLPDVMCSPPRSLSENQQSTPLQEHQPSTVPNNPSPARKKKSSQVPKGPPQKKAKRKQNAVNYVKMESPEEYKRNIRERIEKVLKIASAGGDPITYDTYEQAVIEQPRKGSEVLLRRDIDEIFINNYNPEWMVDWNANIDISPVYDYYGTITYITDYFTKVRKSISLVQFPKTFTLWSVLNISSPGFDRVDQCSENGCKAIGPRSRHEAKMLRVGGHVLDTSPGRRM